MEAQGIRNKTDCILAQATGLKENITKRTLKYIRKNYQLIILQFKRHAVAIMKTEN